MIFLVVFVHFLHLYRIALIYIPEQKPTDSARVVPGNLLFQYKTPSSY